MRRFIIFAIVSVFAAVLCATSCKHKPNVTPDTSNFPDSISAILINECSRSGCHNAASYQDAGDLELDSWGHLFNGGVSGAVVIPYSTTYSPFLYYCNTDSTLGTIVSDPNHFQPYYATNPVTHAQYLTLRNWIAQGAPDKNGNIAFASNADTRQKIYLTNQGCNLVAVIDAQSRQVMRYIPVGDNANNKTPHDVVVSSDGAYAYVSLFTGNFIQKIDTKADAIVSTLDLSNYTLGLSSGQWSIITMSPQDTAFMVSGFLQSGYVVTANTGTMQVNQKKSIDALNSGGGNIFPDPHGLTSNATFDTFFAALQYGNEVAKFSFNTRFWLKPISVNGQPVTSTNSADSVSPNPHQIQMSPDFSKYFVTCQQTGMVSVIDAHTDALLAQIKVGFFPQEMTVCPSKNYLFVACMEDAGNTPPNVGSVYVINYNTLAIVKVIYGDFYEPHDVAVDNEDALFFVANRNASNGGIPSHHSTSCGGNAGWYNVYDLNTLEPADTKRYEVTNDAYAVSARFK